MQMAYLLLAHTDPHQLDRLVSRLEDEHNDIFIHLDLKARDEQLFFQLAVAHRNVFFISNRHDIRWGAYSMIKATLESLNEIVSHKEYDYISLLSGMDYPIKTNAEIYKFFISNFGKEFIAISEIHHLSCLWEVVIDLNTIMTMTAVSAIEMNMRQKWLKEE